MGKVIEEKVLPDELRSSEDDPIAVLENKDDRFSTDAALATCVSCANRGLLPILDLGPMPPSDELLTQEDQRTRGRVLPLRLGLCPSCTLLQLLEAYQPERMFGNDYLYFSSVSETFQQHCAENASELVETLNLGSECLVVEIGSNDGYMLSNFVDKHVPVLGIDPAPHQGHAARQKGVETIGRFFGLELAQHLKEQGREADLIIANNVLAHAEDQNDFVAGMAELLSSEGLIVVEVPYVRDLIDHLEFDTIYHEHQCYFSIRSAQQLFAHHGLFLKEVRRFPVHGGSLRLYFDRSDVMPKAVAAAIEEERNAGVAELRYYTDFAQRVRNFCSKARTFIGQMKDKGYSLAAYGAAAKGTVMLNSLALNSDVIDFVVDRNPHKWGRQIPSTGITIDSLNRLERDRPDYILILPWNLRNEIVKQQKQYLKSGGKLIILLPDIEVIEEA